MTVGIALLQVPEDATVITDPERRILKSEPGDASLGDR
jgi:hypothetical protein